MKASFANRPIQILLDGVELDTKTLRSAASAFVSQALDAPSLVEICFAEPPKDSISAFRYGASIALRVDGNVPLFAGEITTIEHQRDGAGGHLVRIRAYDLLHRLRMRQHSRALADCSAQDLVRKAASDLGIDSSIGTAGPVRRQAFQHDQSDFDFLVDLAMDAGLHLYLDIDVLRLTSLAGDGEALELKVGRELAKVRSTSTVETLRRHVETKAWNLLRTTVVNSTVSLARQDSRDMRSIDSSAFPDLGVRIFYNRIAQDSAEAEGYIQADIDRAAAGEAAVEGTADGDPRIKPGQVVRILGVDDALDGEFAVTRATHLFDAQVGYVTEFSTSAPTRRQRSHQPLFTFGRVSDVNDPDSLSRVKAKLLLMGDLESDWMPVVVAGAGKDKGFAVMPACDDNVLIVFPDGNPAYGIVLGGLYGESRAPGLDSAGTRPFVFRTGNGQCFTLDSANALARLETSGGDRFELGPNGTKLHATRDLLIDAPGRTVTIRARAVEFEEG